MRLIQDYPLLRLNQQVRNGTSMAKVREFRIKADINKNRIKFVIWSNITEILNSFNRILS